MHRTTDNTRSARTLSPFTARTSVRTRGSTADTNAARLTRAGPIEVTASPDAEIIIWETDTEVSR